MAIQITGLKKSYKNGPHALQNIDLSIKPGIYGLLGPNGAGKTTLMRILATVMGFDDGEVKINGFDLRRDVYEIRKIVGYLPQEFGLYPDLTLTEYLDYMCLLNEIKDRSDRKKRINQAIALSNLTDTTNKKLKTFSGGMKRRAGLAQCLLNSPQVLLVDEPTAGLDPEERIRIKNLLSILGKDRIIIFSTHIINDLENVCSDIGILDKGKLLFNGPLYDLREKVSARVWTGSCAIDELSLPEEGYFVVNKRLLNSRWEYRIIGEEAPFTDAISDEMSLEDAYFALMRGEIL
ncbi:MAG: ABC transporter ATP-binding protein [Syntrophomonadaceae bacterium]|nr:ABC transporter ATP-binding protein [Syntrophomonadaceae bacterium]